MAGLEHKNLARLRLVYLLFYLVIINEKVQSAMEGKKFYLRSPARNSAFLECYMACLSKSFKLSVFVLMGKCLVEVGRRKRKKKCVNWSVVVDIVTSFCLKREIIFSQEPRLMIALDVQISFHISGGEGKATNG